MIEVTKITITHNGFIKITFNTLIVFTGRYGPTETSMYLIVNPNGHSLDNTLIDYKYGKYLSGIGVKLNPLYPLVIDYIKMNMKVKGKTGKKMLMVMELLPELKIFLI